MSFACFDQVFPADKADQAEDGVGAGQAYSYSVLYVKTGEYDYCLLTDEPGRYLTIKLIHLSTEVLK